MKTEPVRTCVGCRKTAGKGTLLRYVRTSLGEIVPDPDRRAPGRGAYLHDDPACRALAEKRRSLQRSLKA